MSADHLRIGDAERERAAAELGEHFARGRITVEEHAERLDAVWAARTGGDLRPVFADLPTDRPTDRPSGRPTARPAARPAGARPRGWRRLPTPLLALLGVLLVVAVVTHLPLVLLAVLGWLFLTRRGWCASRARHPWRA